MGNRNWKAGIAAFLAGCILGGMGFAFAQAQELGGFDVDVFTEDMKFPESPKDQPGEGDMPKEDVQIGQHPGEEPLSSQPMIQQEEQLPEPLEIQPSETPEEQPVKTPKLPENEQREPLIQQQTEDLQSGEAASQGEVPLRGEENGKAGSKKKKETTKKRQEPAPETLWPGPSKSDWHVPTPLKKAPAVLSAAHSPSPTATPSPSPTATPKSSPTVTPKPSPRPTATPKLSPSLEAPYPSLPGEIREKEKSEKKKEERLWKLKVIRRKKLDQGEFPRISMVSSAKIEILSFRMDGMEIPWQWKGNVLEGRRVVQKENRTIELLLLLDGKWVIRMEPWNFTEET